MFTPVDSRSFDLQGGGRPVVMVTQLPWTDALSQTESARLYGNKTPKCILMSSEV